MRKQLFIIGSVLLLSTACNSSKEASKAAIGTTVSIDQASVNTVVWQQTSAEYKALCYQAFNIAKIHLQHNVAGGDDYTRNPVAIVMDLDETVLDNSPYEAQLILENKSYSEASWVNWVQSMKAKLVPGAKEFIEFATNMGLNIIFISNRDNSLLEATKQNLRQLGIDVPDENFYLKKGNSDKTERRESVTRLYRIIMLIGDNLSDFSEEFNNKQNISQRAEFTNANKEEFGKKFIILPNPMYGGWQDALKIDNPDSKTLNPKMFLKGY